MQFLLVLNEGAFYVRYPQSGSKSGWSEWSKADRSRMLEHLESGWDYRTVSNLRDADF